MIKNLDNSYQRINMSTNEVEVSYYIYASLHYVDSINQMYFV